MVDDLGYIPDDRILRRLPNIRRIWLEGGLRFRQMYDETPLCCPSRASFLTGQHTWRHGVVRNDGNLLDPSGTIAVALQDAGYHTIMAGNYLNKVRGSRVPPGWDRAFIKGRNSPPTFWRDGRAVTYRGRFVDDVMREQALRWLRRAPTDRPLFAWVAPVAPHVCTFRRSQCYKPPVLPADRGARECRGIPDYRPPSYSTATHPLEARPMPDWPTGWELQRICQSLLVVDRMVGQISAVQARRGRAAVLAFTSDNGMSWGQHGFTFKQTPPAARVPFYVAGTGIVPAIVDALVSKIDIAPTLADVAGIAFPGADGVSFAQLLRGAPFFGRLEHLEVMPRSNVSGGYPGWDALRTPRWHFIRWQTGRRELYDLEADPWELRNLVRSQEDRAAMMEARLNELVAASGGIPPAPPDREAPGVVDRVWHRAIGPTGRLLMDRARASGLGRRLPTLGLLALVDRRGDRVLDGRRVTERTVEPAARVRRASRDPRARSRARPPRREHGAHAGRGARARHHRRPRRRPRLRPRRPRARASPEHPTPLDRRGPALHADVRRDAALLPGASDAPLRQAHAPPRRHHERRRPARPDDHVGHGPR